MTHVLKPKFLSEKQHESHTKAHKDDQVCFERAQEENNLSFANLDIHMPHNECITVCPIMTTTL